MSQRYRQQAKTGRRNSDKSRGFTVKTFFFPISMKQLFTLFFSLLSFSLLGQSVVYVTPGGSGNQSGSSWSNALPGGQLKTRLGSAPSGTQFWLSGGTYTPTTGTDRSVTFSIPSGVQVYGSFTGAETSLSERALTQPYSTILSGEIGDPNTVNDNSYHVVTFRNVATDTRLDGVVIRDGAAVINAPDAFGGGVYNNGSRGGDSRPTIANCSFINNTSAERGGGLCNDGYQGNASPTVLNCQFQNNTSSQGGGMYNNGFQGVSRPLVTNCGFWENKASDGGAVYNEAFQGQTVSTLRNCTFSKNTSFKTYSAGGYSYSSAALYNHAIGGGNATAQFISCIVWGNYPANQYRSIYNDPGVLEVSYSDTEGNDPSINATGPGNIVSDPFFINPSANDFRLLSGSPAINTGDPNSTTGTVSATDLAGKPRVQQGRTDMGAYEYQANPVKVFVTQTGAGNQSGTSWANALPGYLLRSTLVPAASGSVFWLAGGSYSPGAATTETFLIPSGVQVYGGFAGTETVLTDRMLANPSSTTLSGEGADPISIGDNSRHVVTFRNVSADTRLDGVVIKRGNAVDYGNNNSADRDGGGVYNIATATGMVSSPAIANCLFASNTATTNGGGMYSYAVSGGLAAPALSNCIFLNNKAYYGGGFNGYGSSSNSSPTLGGCSFIDNEAVAGGGFNAGAGFYGGENKPTLRNCIFKGNRASSGAGISIGSSFGGTLNPILINCSLTNNQVTGNSQTVGTGGAIYVSSAINSDATLTLTNCTIADNTAAVGSGLYSSRYNDSYLTLGLTNTLVRNNDLANDTDPNRLAPVYTITYSNIQGGFAGTGNIDADPLFVDATNGNYRLLRNSPSINAGDPGSTTTTVSATDLAGGPRIVGGRIDMGAYEFAAMADLRLALNVNTRTPAVGQAVSYNLTITNDGPEPATNVAWQNRLPANLAFVSGTGITSANSVLAGAVPSLQPGAAATFTYLLQPDQPGQYVNAAQITASDQPDPDSQPNSGTEDGQDDVAQADFRTTPDNGMVYTSPNPNQVPLPPVASNQPAPDPNKADLSLAMTVSTRTPKPGDIVTVTLRVDNAGGLTAANVEVKLNLPVGTSFVSSSGLTSVSGQVVNGYIGAVYVGASTTLKIQIRVDAGSPARLTAEILVSNLPDPDSQPDSGVTDGEDDTATVDLRVSQ